MSDTAVHNHYMAWGHHDWLDSLDNMLIYDHMQGILDVKDRALEGRIKALAFTSAVDGTLKIFVKVRIVSDYNNWLELHVIDATREAFEALKDRAFKDGHELGSRRLEVDLLTPEQALQVEEDRLDLGYEPTDFCDLRPPMRVPLFP